MSAPSHGIKIAGVAQRMANILAFSCPPNYRCGGPSYAAQVSIDSILHIMGVGVAVLQLKRLSSVETIETHVKEGAVCGPSMLKAFTKHKSQILGGALHSVMTNIRTSELRECHEVSEEAMLMFVEWYLQKSGTKGEFLKKLEEGGHDQLVELDKTESQI
jgi:hypothetical protein